MTAFISYKSDDATIANQIRLAIMHAGGTVWMAPWDIPPGQDYTQCIPAAIEACDRVILVLSRAANQSDYVRKEIDRAIKYRKPVFPVLIETFEPRGGLEYLIAGNQRIDATLSDPAGWMPQVVERAIKPLDQDVHVKPRVPGMFIKVDARKVAFAGASLATLVSFALHGAPVEGPALPPLLLALRDAAPSPWLMLGMLVLMAAGAWLLQRLNAKGSRTFVVRSSDLVAVSGVLVGGLLSFVFFLFTPLAAAAVMAALYIPLRGHLLRRWGMLAALLVVLVGVSAWWVEGNLYRLAFEKGPAVAVIPICGGGECEWDRGSASYKEIVGGVAEILNGGTGVAMPSSDTAVSFYDSRKAFESRNRWASLTALLAHGRTFDRLVEVTLQPSCTGATEGSGYRLTVHANSIPKRKPPFWSDWGVGAAIPIGNMLEFSGDAPGNSRVASLLLGGLIAESVVNVQLDGAPIPDAELVEIYRRFLQMANEPKVRTHLSETARTAAASGAGTQSADEVKRTFAIVLEELRNAAAPEDGRLDTCEDAGSAALVEMRVRNNVVAEEPVEEEASVPVFEDTALPPAEPVPVPAPEGGQ